MSLPRVFGVGLLVIALTMRISEVQQIRQDKERQSDNSRRHMETIFGKAFD